MSNNAKQPAFPQCASWIEEAPARAWIVALRDECPVWDTRPTPLERWMKGTPTAAMLKGLPKRVAAIGQPRIRVLCRVYRSARRAGMLLVWKGKRVKYKPNGDPYHSENVLRRIEEGSMNLKDQTVREHISTELEANNTRWFIRLGKALEIGSSPKTRQPDFFPDRVDRVAQFIVRNWFEACGARGQLPPLCYATDQIVADICQDVFPTARPTLDSVRKWRKRLKLLRPPRIRTRKPLVDKKRG